MHLFRHLPKMLRSSRPQRTLDTLQPVNLSPLRNITFITASITKMTGIPLHIASHTTASLPPAVPDSDVTSGNV